MKIYIWQEIKHCSDNYHDNGGVVVIADNLERAEKLAMEQGCKFSPEETPDHEIETTSHDEKVIIFPNAGCC